MNLDQHILEMLDNQAGGSRPLTISDFARRFGVSPIIVLPAARRLVEDGLAAPSTVLVRGVPTLHGLLPLSAAAEQPLAITDLAPSATDVVEPAGELSS